MREFEATWSPTSKEGTLDSLKTFVEGLRAEWHPTTQSVEELRFHRARKDRWVPSHRWSKGSEQRCTPVGILGQVVHFFSILQLGLAFQSCSVPVLT